MFDKMVKMKNRKGFTLIEMLVVVAILAILVSILVPVIGNSTTKSRAATNAANLRAVQAELATLKVSHPECFVANSSQTPGDEVAGWIESWLGEGAGTAFMDTVTAINGTLIFTGGFGEVVTLENVPTSVAVQADDGMDVTEGTQVVVYLIGNEIVATYAGSGLGGRAFNVDDFAKVAETGKFTGEGMATGGSSVQETIDKAAAIAKCALSGGHYWTNPTPGTHACSNCPEAGTCSDRIGSLSLTDARDGVCDTCKVHVHAEETIDGVTKCKWSDCGKTKCEMNGVEHNYNDNNICEGCGLKDPTACDHADANKDHVCDNGCDEVMGGECGATLTNNHCAYCGKCYCENYEMKSFWSGKYYCKNCGNSNCYHTD